MPERSLAVHLSAMADLDDLDDSSFVVNGVDDPAGTLANPKALGLAGKLLGARGTRSAGEALDSGDDPNPQSSGLDGFELLCGGRLDEDAIACHAAEGL